MTVQGVSCKPFSLSLPENMIVIRNTTLLVKLECKRGYQIKESNGGIFICVNGKWIGLFSYCTRKYNATVSALIFFINLLRLLINT